MGVASWCGEQEVGVARGIYGCVPYTTYPCSSCICSFLQKHPYFLFILKMFFVLVSVLFVIKFYVYIK